MDTMRDLTALLKHEVEDLISAEDQIIDAMPLMIETAKNATLKKSLRDHLRVTKSQRKRLDKVQKLLGVKKSSESEGKGFFSSLFGGLTTQECKGMKGIIEEGNKLMAADMADTVKDAAIIASAQKVEHYEICGYGTARAYAKELNLPEVAGLLEETLNEEYEADKILTTLAEKDVNAKAEGKNAVKATAKKSNANGVLSGAANRPSNGTGASGSGSAGNARKAAAKKTSGSTASKAGSKTGKK